MKTVPLERAERWAASPQTTPLEIIEPAAWQGQPIPARRWLVDGWIPYGAVTMLGGDGGVGKSLLTMQLLAAVSTGRRWIGLETAHVKALGVYCEDERDELHRRMAEVLDAEGQNFADIENMQIVSRVGKPNEFIARDKYGKPKGPTIFYEHVLSAAKDFGAQLVVLDGLHDLFDGNENSRPEARQFVNMLRRIALEIDGVVVLCAHPSMAGLSSGAGTSGSTAWNNAVRSRPYFTRPKVSEDKEEDSDARVLRSMKSNYGKVGDEIRLQWRGGVFVTDRLAAPASGIVATITREQAFLACLDAAAKQGRHVTDASNSPRYAPKVFATMPQSGGERRREIEIAMRQLFDGGRIRVGSAMGADRHLIKAIVRTET